MATATSSSQIAAAVTLEQAYQQATAALRARVLAMLEALFRALGSWRNADIPVFAQRATPVLLAGQRQMAALTSAYLNRQMQELTGKGLTVSAAPVDLVNQGMRGIPLADELERPFHDVWSALHEGKPIDQAVDAGLTRLDSLAATDLQLAKTHTSRQLMSSDDRIVGYRRVLEGPYSCGLCVVASTQRYHKADLLPIHNACDCAVAPLVGDHDPGQVIDEQRLADAHAQITERFGKATADARGNRHGIPPYHDVLVVHQHGELGPVLGVRGQDFTGPSDLPS